MANVTVTIDGDDVLVDVDGVSGKKCMTLTQFLRSAPGVKVVDLKVKADYSTQEVPTEVKTF